MPELAAAVVMHNDHVLIVRRSRSEGFLPGRWGVPCGKIDEGEYSREREEWAQRGAQVLQALDTITQKDVIAETPADDAAVDGAIDDAIEAAIQTYRQRNPQ